MTKYFPHDHVPNYDFGAFKIFCVEHRKNYVVKDEPNGLSMTVGDVETALSIIQSWTSNGFERVSVTEIKLDEGRVLSQRAHALLSLITRRSSGKISAIAMLRGIYHTMTGENMGLREAKDTMEFYWDNYERMD